MTNHSIPADPPSRMTRAKVMLRAIIERRGQGAPTTHRVRDLSVQGMCVDQANDLPVGGTVLISVGALQSIEASVLWSRDGLAGLKFADPIDLNDARAKTAITAQSPAAEPPASEKGPTAGWMADLKNPYLK